MAPLLLEFHKPPPINVPAQITAAVGAAVGAAPVPIVPNSPAAAATAAAQPPSMAAALPPPAAAVPAGVGSPMVAAQKAKPAKAELRWKGPVVWR